MAKKKLSARGARRAAERDNAKLTRDIERLSLLEPGGAPDRPIDLASASQVEVSARSMPCPRCRGPLRVEEHAAESSGAARLRVAHVVCRDCGSRRAIYFRLGGALPS